MKYTRWSIFICYRRVDGAKAAHRVHSLLNGQRINGPDGVKVEIDAYLDTEMPGVANWKDHHRPYLERARAIIVVCTPAACLDHGPDDWVQKEIRWWLDNKRDVAPILIDPLEDGDRYVPEEVKRRWGDIQRIPLIEERLDSISAAELKERLEGVRSKILGVLVPAGIDDFRREVEREKARSRRLSALLVASVFLGLMALFSYGTSRLSEAKTLAALSQDLATRGSYTASLATLERSLAATWGIDIITPSEVKLALFDVLQRTPIVQVGQRRNVGDVDFNYSPNIASDVQSFGFLDDMNALVIKKNSGRIEIFDLDTGNFTNKFESSRPDAPAIFWNGDGVAELLQDLEGRLYIQVGTTRTDLLDSNEFTDSISEAKFSDDGALVALTSEGGPVGVWRATDGARTLTFSHDRDEARSIAFSRDGSKLLIAFDSGVAMIWDATDNSSKTYEISDVPLVYAEFSDDLTHFLTISRGGKMSVHHLREGLNHNHDLSLESVTAATFVPNQRTVHAFLSDGTSRVIRLGVKHQRRFQSSSRYVDPVANLGEQFRHGWVTSAQYSATGEYVAVRYRDGVFELYRSAMLSQPTSANGSLVESFGEVPSATHGVDEGRRVTLENGRIRVEIAASNKFFVTEFSNDTDIERFLFSIDGTYVFVRFADERVMLWNLDNDEIIKGDFLPSSTAVRHITNRGHMLLEGEGVVQSLDQSSEPANLPRSSYNGSSISFDPCPSAPVLRLWNAQTGEFFGDSVHHNCRVQQVISDPSGQYLLTVSHDHFAKLVEASSGQLRQEFFVPSRLSHAQFLDQGKTVVVLGHHRVGGIFDVESGEIYGSVIDHDEYNQSVHVYALEISDDGNLALTFSGDLVRLWNAKTGEPIGGRFWQENINNHADFMGGWAFYTTDHDGIPRVLSTTHNFTNLKADLERRVIIYKELAR